MRLTSQKLPAIEDVTVADLDRAFEGGAIGKFAHLWSSDVCFIQAGSRGTPSRCVPPDDPFARELWSFIHRTGSEPWNLEQIDRAGRANYQAREWLTLEEVRRAFVAYLQGDAEWDRGLSWIPMRSGCGPRPAPPPGDAPRLSDGDEPN